MKFPLFASFLIFTVWFTINLARTNRKEEDMKRAFWEKERRANNTRRKPLDNLPYIEIPLERLSIQLLPEDPKAMDCKEIFRSLSEDHRSVFWRVPLERLVYAQHLYYQH